MKKMALGIGLTGLFLVQASIIPFFFNGIHQPDIWLVIIVLSTLVLPPKYTMLIALAGGLAQDIMIGNFFGLHFFPYVAVAVFFAYGLRREYNRKWHVSLMLALSGTLLYALFSLMIAWVGLPSFPGILYGLRQTIPLLFWNGALSLLVHPLIWKMEQKEETEWQI